MARRKVNRPVQSDPSEPTPKIIPDDVTMTRSLDEKSHVAVTPEGDSLQHTAQQANSSSPVDMATLPDEITLPVVAEELDVHKRKVTTAHVRISKRVRRHQQVVDEPTVSETVEVQRVPVNQPVEQPPQVRQEGDTTIIPVLEERLVVTKQLVVVEEIHVIRRRQEHHEPQTVTLAHEHMDVERLYSKESKD